MPAQQPMAVANAGKANAKGVLMVRLLLLLLLLSSSVLSQGNYRTSVIGHQPQKSKLPRAAQRTESLTPKNDYLTLSQAVFAATGDRQKCKKCNDFFANEEYGARSLCSGCFKKLSIEESTQKPSHYQSKQAAGRTLTYPRNTPTRPQSDQIFLPKCISTGCGRNAAINYHGYCEQCFYANHRQFQQ